jgi:hypothetical protein
VLRAHLVGDLLFRSGGAAYDGSILRNRASRVTLLAVALGAAVGLVVLPAGRAEAAPPSAAELKGRQGLLSAKRGDCIKAIPLLEEAEDAKHKPVTASALAGCYVKVGDLVRASDIYLALSQEKVTRAHTRDDKAAIWGAKRKAAQLDERIPTITFKPAEPYQGLEVAVDGARVEELDTPRRVDPNVTFTVTARAAGRKPFEASLELEEKERREFVVKLELAPNAPPKEPEEGGGKGLHALWVGARFRGMIIPQFLMSAFGDGGATVFVPGADVTLTKSMSAADVVFSLGYSSYGMGEVPFKLRGRPDTEYEILESDMHALLATAGITWNVPLDRGGKLSLRLGANIGVGVVFAGGLYRTQAYPLIGSPNDPASYVKCGGPNDPAGTFRYCNQLDKDADHYDGYAEPSWFSGGARPLIFPWLTIPELGLAWRATPRVTVDFGLGLSLSGAMVSLGGRYGL